jgi:predicted type IV restriction endonuclease
MGASAPKLVSDLVERFSRDRKVFLSTDYKEEQLRAEFLNPFFESLGWDVSNKAGLTEVFKPVIHEESIKVAGATKAPDYTFRIGGRRVFFAEAKKPAVNIAEDASPAFQLRRYAWTSKLPVSLLSDFEQFAVYDCRIQPYKTDKPATARTMLLGYTEYLERWEELLGLFSPDAIQKGSLDHYVETSKSRKGTATVDDAFLAEIEKWRDMLARNIALRNPRLSTRELNFAVQRTIDRLIFLRICEDRGIEHYAFLQSLMNGERVYPRLVKHFRDADDRYNSGLFHFGEEKARAEAPDKLTLDLDIDDKPLKEIIGSLYYPDCPYEFSVLPADILGQVYEQFLGKVIRLTAGHQAKVEEKPEVRKAGGVYYTPTYIVDYIVKNTVGKLVEDKTPKQVEALRILDPACGSGSFLLGAYQFLLDWHLTYYIEHPPSSRAPRTSSPLYKDARGNYRLTTAERKRILLNSIYGVDIDSQAVEVTKLSLLLKVLEGENQETLQNQLKFFHERALPDLGSNIKCGNSLIGPDFYQNQQSSLFDQEEQYRINVFDWNAAFPAIMKSGGFDAVIGNPPYVRQESLKELKDYLAQHYEAFDSTADLYAYFMERSTRLLRDGGRFSVIVSSSFLRTSYGEMLRRTLKKHAAVLRVVDFGGLAVFENAKDTYVCIPLLAKVKQPPRVDVTKVPSVDIRDIDAYASENKYAIPHERLSAEAWALTSDKDAAVFGKIVKAGVPLGRYVERRMFFGLKTGANDAFVIDKTTRKQLIAKHKESEGMIRPVLGGEDVRRYHIRDSGKYLIVVPSGWTQQQVSKAPTGRASTSERAAWAQFASAQPSIAEHLEQFADALRRRQDHGEYWWELRPCDYYEYLDRPKIMYPDIGKSPRFYLDRAGVYLTNTAYFLGLAEPYLLGLLNSRVFWFAISNISIPFGTRAGEFRYRLFYQYMEKIPIRPIDFSNETDKARHDKMVELVERMLDLHKQLPKAKIPHEQESLKRTIAATDAQIDALVYELYRLTEDEVRIVEGTRS